MHVGFVDGEKLIEFGKFRAKEIDGDLAGRFHPFPDGCQGQALALPVMILDLLDPLPEIRKGLSVGRTDQADRKILYGRQGFHETAQGVKGGFKKIRAEVRRDVRQDVIPGNQNALLPQKEATVAGAVSGSGQDFKRPVPDGVCLAVPQRSVQSE